MESQFPSDVELSKQAILNDASEDKLANGAIVAFSIDKVTPILGDSVSGDGQGPGRDIILKFQASVRNPDDTTKKLRTKIFFRFILPESHPDYPKHKPPSWAYSLWRGFVEAIVPERCTGPAVFKSGKYVTSAGKVVQDRKAYEVDRSTLVHTEAKIYGIQQKGKFYVGKGAYGITKHAEDSDFVNINGITGKLKQGDNLTPLAELYEKTEVAEETLTKKKGTKKKGTKKKA